MRIVHLAFFLAAMAASSPGLSQSFAKTDGLLIEYDYRSSGVALQTPEPLVRVYGDGTLMVTIPYQHKDRGVYRGKLAETELQELVLSIEKSPILFVSQAEVETMLAKRAQESTDFYQSEVAQSRFSFALSGKSELHHAKWDNLGTMRKRFSKSISDLDDIWDIDRQLYALKNHPSLQLVSAHVEGGVTR